VSVVEALGRDLQETAEKTEAPESKSSVFSVSSCKNAKGIIVFAGGDVEA
jgi:hypothetical protein